MRFRTCVGVCGSGGTTFGDRVSRCPGAGRLHWLGRGPPGILLSLLSGARIRPHLALYVGVSIKLRSLTQKAFYQLSHLPKPPSCLLFWHSNCSSLGHWALALQHTDHVFSAAFVLSFRCPVSCYCKTPQGSVCLFPGPAPESAKTPLLAPLRFATCESRWVSRHHQ